MGATTVHQLGPVHEYARHASNSCMTAVALLAAHAGYGYLIVATATQCHVYNTNNLNTPHIFDLKDTVTLLLQVRAVGSRQKL